MHANAYCIMHNAYYNLVSVCILSKLKQNINISTKCFVSLIDFVLKCKISTEKSSIFQIIDISDFGRNRNSQMPKPKPNFCVGFGRNFGFTEIRYISNM
jgi:hypothetical protein